MTEMTELLPAIGIALVFAFLGGKLAHWISVPQVSIYLLVGVLMGPSGFGLIPVELLKNFDPINDLVFGLILFNIGGEFHRGLIKKITRHHIKYSLFISFFVFIIVSLVCFGFSFFSDMGMAHKLAYSLFLGVVAIAAAPPTVLLVIKELEAKGPLTQALMVFLAVGTVAAIIGAEVLVFTLSDLGVWEGGGAGIVSAMLTLIWSIFGSLLLGLAIGLVLSFWEQREAVESELLFAVVCGLLLGQSLAHYLGTEPLLMSLFMGFVLVNTSPTGQAIHAKVKGMGLSLYALFFIIAGAHIHIQQQFGAVGLLGLGYIVARVVALIVGSRWALRYSMEDAKVGRYMGLATLSHAGAALAIISKIGDQHSVSAQNIITVVMASIFVFELIGPLILRWTLCAAGEVRVGGVLGESISGSTLSMLELGQNFLQNLGILKPVSVPALTSIKLLVRRKVYAINKDASIAEVVRFVDKHHLPIYPVVGEDYKFEGIISISDLKEVIFDPLHSKYSKAFKLVGSRVCLNEETNYEEAMETFSDSLLEVLPVVSCDTKKLVGTLGFKDLILAMKHD